MSSFSASSDILREYGYEGSQIIQILNRLQDTFGYLPFEEIKFIAEELNLPISHIWGIITFYSHYRLKPPAKYVVRVCNGTACHVKNSKMLQETFVKEFTESELVHVETETVACLGCCALAPVFEVNHKIHGKLNTQLAKELAKKIGEDIE